MTTNSGQINASIFPRVPIYMRDKYGKEIFPLVMDPVWVQFFWGMFNRTGGTTPITFPIQPILGGTGHTSFTEGDILVAAGSTSLASLGIGLNQQVLTVDISVPGKIKWATPDSQGTGSDPTDQSANALQQLADFSTQLYNELQSNLGQQIQDLSNQYVITADDIRQFCLDSIGNASSDVIIQDNTQFVLDTVKGVGSRTIRIDVQFGDVNVIPLYKIPAGLYVLNARIIIETAFNGTNPTISIGDTSDNARLMSTTQNYLGSTRTYQSTPSFKYNSETQINVYFTSGSSSVGVATVFMTVQT